MYLFILICSLLKDLNDWTTLYAAGRLMKPVRSIKNGSNEIKNALLLNRLHAVRTSLLLMPIEFNEIELYQTIASLSYIGDPRMLIGENPKKVWYSHLLLFFVLLGSYVELFLLLNWCSNSQLLVVSVCSILHFKFTCFLLINSSK